MWKLILRPVFLHRREIIGITISFLIFIIALLFSGRMIGFWSAFSIEKQMFQIEEGMRQDLGYISGQREAIIASKILNDALKKSDSPQLLNLVQNEAEKRNLDFIIVTDKDGFVLTRSNLPAQQGDNIFQTFTQGRKMAQGETVTAIVRTSRSPLSSMSGSLIFEENKPIGSVIVGHIFNDSYAIRFQEKYLKQRRAEVIFYASPEGVIGSGSDNKQTTQLINAYFSLGSDLVAQNLTGLSKEIKINGNYYAIRHIIFSGNGENPSGAFILFPIRHSFYSFVLAGGIMLLFFIFYFLTFFLKFLNRCKRSVPSSVLLTGLALFVAVYFATLVKLDSASIELKKSPYLIYNSVIKFTPEADIIKQFSEKTVAIQVFTGGEAINAVSAVVRYDPKALKVLDIFTENSLCDPSFFLEKEIDQEKGKATIVCGIPNPGFSEPVGTVAELLVQPLATGGASLEFTEETQVLANDGLGTNVLRAVTDGFYQVVAQEFTAANIQNPITIFSSSHPNSNRWYKEKQVKLSWPSPADTVQYRYVLSRSPNPAAEDKILSTANNFLDFSVDESGEYYLRIQEEYSGGNRGPVSQFKIMIDATPPLPPKIQTSSREVKRGEIVRLDFTSKDESSGLQSGFFVKVNEGIFLPVKPPFYIPFLESGKYSFVIRAFDRANNFSDSSVVITVND